MGLTKLARARRPGGPEILRNKGTVMVPIGAGTLKLEHVEQRNREGSVRGRDPSINTCGTKES